MSDRSAVAKSTARGLQKFASRRHATPVMLGFDGFVDSIIAVVDKRHSLTKYDAIPTIGVLGKKITAAAGMSSNYELVVRLQKLGGNGPIMANAMVAAGLPVTYVGSVGPVGGPVHKVFAPLAQRARVLPIAPPGLTDALEFDDGKVMLGKYDWLTAVNWASIDKALGAGKLAKIIAPARFLGMVNWTMMPGLSDVWTKLCAALPKLSKERKLIFIDLADPEKRTRADLVAALKLTGRLQKVADVMLGLNLKEAVQVAAALGIDSHGEQAENHLEEIAGAIRAKLGLHTVVIHPRQGAAAARCTDGQVQTALFRGPFVAKPKLSTGAGDNFNAGFCLGSLAGLTLEECLCCGTATSGYYVRHAASPTLAQLAKFCAKLPQPE